MTITRNFSVLANGAGSANNLSLGGATIGTNALAVTGSSSFPGSTTITSAGLLGIGMTPSNVLDITQTQNGLAKVNVLNGNAGASSRAMYALNNGTSELNISILGTGWTTAGLNYQGGISIVSTCPAPMVIGNTGAQAIVFATSGAENARFDSSGRLQINTTGISANVAIQQTGGQDTLSLFGSANTGNLTQVGFYNLARVFCGQIYIDAAGHTTTYATSSNADLKDVASDQSNYRQKIQDLWVGDYTWKDTGAARFGVLAQQVHEVLGGESGFAFQPAKSDGNWSVSSEPFAFLALWGVKDLYAENEALKARLAALENK